MSKGLGEVPFRPRYVALGLAGLAVVVWLAFPAPFVRGIVLGAVVGPVAAVGALALLARRMQRRVTGNLQPPALPMTRWDLELRVEDLEGTPLDLASLSGRVLILNIWATWCAPCLAEMPSLAKLREATADLDVDLVCVTNEPAAKVREFVAKRPLRLPVYVLQGEWPEVLRSRAIPVTFVVDRNGSIALRHSGAAAWDRDEVIQFVRSLALAPSL